MSLPTRTQVLTLDFSLGGRPCCTVEAKAGLASVNLDYSIGGRPSIGLIVVSAGSIALYTLVGGVLKNVPHLYGNIDGSVKEITRLYMLVAGVVKELG